MQSVRTFDLAWSGPSGTTYVVSRNGVPIATGVQATSYTDTLGPGGTVSYTYKVCVSGSMTSCSNEVTVRI